MSRRVHDPLGFFAGGIGMAAAIFALCLLLPANLVAQHTSPPSKTANPINPIAGQQGGVIQVIVLADDKKLDRQAVVQLYGQLRQVTTWQTTTDRSETTFGDLPFGKYDIEVSAVGYISSHKEVEVGSLIDTVQITVALQRDPSAIEFNSSHALMSPKAGEEMRRAIKALNSSNLKEAQKRLEDADKLSPANARLKTLLGYTFLQKGDFEQAQAYLTEARTLDPHNGHALMLLGRVQLLRGQSEQARTTLEQAVAAERDNWIEHNLLADAYLQQHEYEKAREQAQLAIDTGGEQGTAAQLALGEALANLGQNSQAIQALNAFLGFQSKSPAASHAQELLEQLRHHLSNATEGSAARLQQTASFTVATDLVPAANSNLLDMSWQPPDTDREKPPVAAGLVCPYEKVIEGAGERVEQLVANVAKFAAIEELVHEKLDPMGNPSDRETRTFDYAASMSQTQPDVVQVDEYRFERYGLDNLPDRIVDNGFAAHALVFHPAMRDAFLMTCEGLGDWHGQATWLIHFKQREDRPNHLQAYLVGTQTYPVNLKGRAWITADKFQIVRIESEMETPLPQIQLLAEHQITEYGPVPFRKTNTELWLPKTAEVYIYFHGQRYYRKHTFGKYMLFSVDAEDKVHEAKHNPTGPESTVPRKHKVWPT